MLEHIHFSTRCQLQDAREVHNTPSCEAGRSPCASRLACRCAALAPLMPRLLSQLLVPLPTHTCFPRTP